MIASGDKVRKFYAHSAEGKPTSEWQGLNDHLLNVAGIARKFAKAFNAGDWAYLAGLWRDTKSIIERREIKNGTIFDFIRNIRGDSHMDKTGYWRNSGELSSAAMVCSKGYF